MLCRHCSNPLHQTLVDLGTSPPSNAYLNPEDLDQPELYYPLRVLVCEKCWLVQTQDFAQAHSLFDANYAYFSAFSASWLEHSREYVEQMASQLSLDPTSLVVEVAANDGYLLQYVKALGIPCVGVEPTASTAKAARAKGIDIIEDFFGVGLAEKLRDSGKAADLLVANNVLAHVPDINDFVRGFAILLKPDGVATFEFPHLLSLIRHTQFDTIYHEHFSYLSLTAVEKVFKTNGLQVFDVQSLTTHGGSLRVFAQRNGDGKRPVGGRVISLLAEEQAAGIESTQLYEGFQDKTEKVKNDFLEFLIDARVKNKFVAAYGAAAKGNTLLNFAGIRSDLIRFVVDRNPAKQGKFLPGSRIPIVAEDELKKLRPDVVVILPWNLQKEIVNQLDYVKAWGASFVTAIPSLTKI